MTFEVDFESNFVNNAFDNGGGNSSFANDADDPAKVFGDNDDDDDNDDESVSYSGSEEEDHEDGTPAEEPVVDLQAIKLRGILNKRRASVGVVETPPSPEDPLSKRSSHHSARGSSGSHHETKPHRKTPSKGGHSPVRSPNSKGLYRRSSQGATGGHSPVRSPIHSKSLHRHSSHSAASGGSSGTPDRRRQLVRPCAHDTQRKGESEEKRRHMMKRASSFRNSQKRLENDPDGDEEEEEDYDDRDHSFHNEGTDDKEHAQAFNVLQQAARKGLGNRPERKKLERKRVERGGGSGGGDRRAEMRKSQSVRQVGQGRRASLVEGGRANSSGQLNRRGCSRSMMAGVEDDYDKHENGNDKRGFSSRRTANRRGSCRNLMGGMEDEEADQGAQQRKNRSIDMGSISSRPNSASNAQKMKERSQEFHKASKQMQVAHRDSVNHTKKRQQQEDDEDSLDSLLHNDSAVEPTGAAPCKPNGSKTLMALGNIANNASGGHFHASEHENAGSSSNELCSDNNHGNRTFGSGSHDHHQHHRNRHHPHGSSPREAANELNNSMNEIELKALKMKKLSDSYKMAGIEAKKVTTTTPDHLTRDIRLLSSNNK